MPAIMACPGCGLTLPATGEKYNERYNASYECWQVYCELSGYTLSLQDPDFIHQLAVDTYGAQHATLSAKPIGVMFALAGLYLTFEHDYTGRQVQRAHTLLANKSRHWPQFRPPEEKAPLMVLDVVNTPEQERRQTLREWGKAVWNMWHAEHANVATIVHKYLDV